MRLFGVIWEIIPWEKLLSIEYSTRKMRVDFKLNYTKGGIWTVKFCHFHPLPAPKFKFNEQKKVEQTETDSAWRRRGPKYCRTY